MAFDFNSFFKAYLFSEVINYCLLLNYNPKELTKNFFKVVRKNVLIYKKLYLLQYFDNSGCHYLAKVNLAGKQNITNYLFII